MNKTPLKVILPKRSKGSSYYECFKSLGKLAFALNAIDELSQEKEFWIYLQNITDLLECFKINLNLVQGDSSPYVVGLSLRTLREKIPIWKSSFSESWNEYLEEIDEIILNEGNIHVNTFAVCAAAVLSKDKDVHSIVEDLFKVQEGLIEGGSKVLVKGNSLLKLGELENKVKTQLSLFLSNQHPFTKSEKLMKEYEKEHGRMLASKYFGVIFLTSIGTRMSRII